MFIDVDVVGYIAATLTTVSFVPQAYLVYKTKNTEGISLAMFIIFNLGLMAWLGFGILLHSLPIMIANAITLVLGLYILGMKIRSLKKFNS